MNETIPYLPGLSPVEGKDGEPLEQHCVLASSLPGYEWAAVGAIHPWFMGGVVDQIRLKLRSDALPVAVNVGGGVCFAPAVGRQLLEADAAGGRSRCCSLMRS